tara:strand:- start:2048 stop:3484 length:1437 start_codon:yes stop_codon:yes gene_type:complete
MKANNLFDRIILGVIFLAITSTSLYANINLPDFSEIADKYAGSVVNISSRQNQQNIDPFNGIDPNEVPDVFKDWYEKNKNSQQPETYSSLGSGFVIESNGIIITNSHVIQDADEIEVTFSDGLVLPAELLGKDPKTDIAVLKVNPEDNKELVALEFGDSDDLKVGEWVIAIGNPFGLGGTVTAGIVSAKNRDIRAGPYDNFIQTDASINRGNSGGPLFNTNGEVIGINSAIISTTGGSVGIGFAIPSKTAISVIDQLIEFGETRRGWLGVRIQEVSEEIAMSLGLEEASGALVVAVDEDSPARKSGIKSGDIILEFNGVFISAMRELPRIVAETKVGSIVDVTLWRNGKKISKSVKLERLMEYQVSGAIPGTQEPQSEDEVLELGFALSKVTPRLTDKYDLRDGQNGLVVTSVQINSDAYERGLREGDLINILQEPDLYSVKQFTRIVEKYRNSDKDLMLIKVFRGKSAIKIFPILIN